MRLYLALIGLSLVLPLRSETALETAQALRWKGQYAEALKVLKQEIDDNPSEARAWYELGLSYASEGDYAHAVDAERTALQHGLQVAECHCALSLALRETRQSRPALLEARRCLEEAPNNAGAYNLMGNAELDLNEEGQAQKDYEAALRLMPNYLNARFNLAWLEKELGAWADAEANYRILLQLQPKSEEAELGLAELLLKEGDREEAQKAFLQAALLDPEDPAPQWGLARILRAQGRIPAAREHEAAYRQLMAASDRRQGEQARLRAAASSKAMDAWNGGTHDGL